MSQEGGAATSWDDSQETTGAKVDVSADASQTQQPCLCVWDRRQRATSIAPKQAPPFLTNHPCLENIRSFLTLSGNVVNLDF